MRATEPKTIKIRVGWLDILRGCPAKSCGCPIWLALNRNGCGYLLVHPFNLFNTQAPWEARRIPLPRRAKDFIWRFDVFNGPRLLRPLFFHPFTFQLELP